MWKMGTRLFVVVVVVFSSSSSSLNNNIFLSFSLSFFIYRGNARKTCFVDSQRISLENLMKSHQKLRFFRDFSPFFVRFSSIFASFLLVYGAFNRVLTKKSQFSGNEKMSFLPVFSVCFGARNGFSILCQTGVVPTVSFSFTLIFRHGFSG